MHQPQINGSFSLSRKNFDFNRLGLFAAISEKFERGPGGEGDLEKTGEAGPTNEGQGYAGTNSQRRIQRRTYMSSQASQ